MDCGDDERGMTSTLGSEQASTLVSTQSSAALHLNRARAVGVQICQVVLDLSFGKCQNARAFTLSRNV